MSRVASLGPALALATAAALVACTSAAGSPSSSATEAPATRTASASAAATSSGSASASASDEERAEERVDITGSQFEPEELTIAAGTEVIFENLDGFAHTVTEGTGGRAVDDPIVDEEIDAGETVRVRFDDPGTYDITCAIHPTMQMTVVVGG